MADNFAIDHHSEILDKKMSVVFSQLTSCITDGFTRINNTLSDNMLDIKHSLVDISKNISEMSDNVSEVADNITEITDIIKHLDDIDRSITNVDQSISDGFESVINFASNTMNDIYAKPVRYREDYEDPD